MNSRFTPFKGGKTPELKEVNKSYQTNNPIIQSLIQKKAQRPDSDVNFATEGSNERQNEHSYYMNFAENSSLRYTHQHTQESEGKNPLLQINVDSPSAGGEYYFQDQDGDNNNNQEIEEIFAHQQRTSVFPGMNLPSERSNSMIQHEDLLGSRQQKIQEMLKEFNKKKDKVMKEQIKSRVEPANQQQSTKNATTKKIFTVDQTLHSHRDNKFLPPQIFTVEDELYKTKYQIQDYKKACGTCKSMKQSITPKMQTITFQSNNEPPISDLKKLREKFNTSEISSSKPQQSKYISQRAQQLREYNLDELIRIIEQLEKENADLKLQLQDALSKLARLENRDDIILQYQNEINLSRQRLNLNTQTLKDVQGQFKILLSIVGEISRLQKSATDKFTKSKLQEISNRVKQILGGQENVEKIDSVIQENNLQGLMQECLQTRVKNMHQREILNMEKEFHSNLELMRVQLKVEIQDEFKKEIQRLKNDVKDRIDEIEELKEIKGQLKHEILKRDNRTDELSKKIKHLEETNQQLEDIVKEADQGLLLKEQYGILQQEFEDSKIRFSEKLQSLELQVKDHDKERNALKEFYKQELKKISDMKDILEKQNEQQKKEISQMTKQIEGLQKLEHLKEKMDEVETQRLSIIEKEKTFVQKERNIKLLQEQLEDLEERNRLLEKSKKKLEINLGMQKQTKEKLMEQNSKQEEDLKKNKEEINNLINEKCEIEQKLQDSKLTLQKLDGMIKDKREFQKLEELVSQVQSSIMLKSQSHFSESDKQLIRELFGGKLNGISEDQNERMNEMKDENNRLYFELRDEFCNYSEALKRQKEYLKQLQEFAKAILTIEDKAIEKNFHLTIQKRNKAPLFVNLEHLIQEAQQRIEDLESKQMVMDRQNLDKGMEKFDEGLLVRKNSVKSIGPQSRGSPRLTKKIKISEAPQPQPQRDQHQLNAQQEYLQLAPHLSNRQPSIKKKNTFNSSDFGQNSFKEAVEDPQFIEELMSSNNTQVINLDRGTQGSDFSMNEKLLKGQSKLKKQINTVLGVKNGNQRGSSVYRRQNSKQRERLIGSVTFTRNKSKLTRTITGGENINESGINFFQDQEDIGNSFEVRVETEYDMKNDLLQFIHCQAMFLEDNKEEIKYFQQS